MRLVWGHVGRVVETAPGYQRLDVTTSAGESSAVCYTSLTGECTPGERVLLNMTAVHLRLGTGGTHFVVARGGGGDLALDDPSGGHIMKLRYSPLQRDVLAVESQESPHHEVMERAEGLGGMPVVCCGLHSQVPLVAAGIKEVVPDARVAYVMTDQAAMMMAVSDLVRRCEAAGLLDATITAGQAFGGGLEAVTLHSALLAARHVAGAEVVIVGIGPGVVGTGTPFGHGGIAQGEAINATGVLGGRPIAALRLSFADDRERHRGVSHHSLTALGRIALVSALVAVPHLPDDQAGVVDAALEGGGIWVRHERADVAATVLPDLRGVEVRSMGRGPSDDPAFFLAAAAAGRAAASLLDLR
jgi:hypothetical protein